MSILKRIIAEDLAPLLRRRAHDGAPVVEQPSAPAASPQAPAHSEQRARQASGGRRVVILSWKAGENDPFSVMSQAVRGHFHACGKNVEILELATEGWANRVAELGTSAVEFAFTWQGLGSRATLAGEGRNLWDHLRIPLVCLHGDHPSHMPPNHALESAYCHHLYTNAEFARYSNRHFRRITSASVIDIPQLHREPRLASRTGDYFVIAKNMDDPMQTERRWRGEFPKPLYDACTAIGEELKSRIAAEPYVEFHDVIDDLIRRNGLDWLSPEVAADAHHRIHSELDFYVHAHKTLAALASMREFPVRVYGRGWERVATGSPAHHAFFPGRDMASSQELYYSRYGLVDISPAKRLHDRTRRAMVNGTGFLSSANLEDSFASLQRFAPLFYDFRPHDLPAKCAAVVRDPDAHAELARQFADLYHDRFHFSGFVGRIDQLAALSRGR